MSFFPPLMTVEPERRMAPVYLVALFVCRRSPSRLRTPQNHFGPNSASVLLASFDIFAPFCDEIKE
jgi:hypothetical protein